MQFLTVQLLTSAGKLSVTSEQMNPSADHLEKSLWSPTIWKSVQVLLWFSRDRVRLCFTKGKLEWLWRDVFPTYFSTWIDIHKSKPKDLNKINSNFLGSLYLPLKIKEGLRKQENWFLCINVSTFNCVLCSFEYLSLTELLAFPSLELHQISLQMME